MADRITLTGLECFGFHGVFDHEKREGQKFTVDLICWLDFAEAAATDDLAKTINYADLAQLAHNIVTGTPRDLVETVAVEIAETAMHTYPMLHAIEVTLHKPQAPIPHDFSDVAVTARRSRKKLKAAP